MERDQEKGGRYPFTHSIQGAADAMTNQEPLDRLCLGVGGRTSGVVQSFVCATAAIYAR